MSFPRWEIDGLIDHMAIVTGSIAFAHEANWGPRNRLALFFSQDNGIHWSEPFDLENEPDGEFSYPAVVALLGDGLAVTYTWRRRGIVFFRAALDELVRLAEPVPAEA